MADEEFHDRAGRVEDAVLGGGRVARGGEGRRGRGRGGGGGSNRQVQISKALSQLLRHQAQNAGIQLDAEGFAPLDRVVGSFLLLLLFLFPFYTSTSLFLN